MEAWTGAVRQIDPLSVKVDHRYQRDEKASLVYAIAADFSWPAFGVLTVFERSTGELYCADGQQRLAAVKMMEDAPTLVPAAVFPANGLKTEAEVFDFINVLRKQLGPMEKHKAKLIAEDPAALAIERSVEKTGFTLLGGGKGPNNIQAVETLYYVYNNLGEKGVEDVLVVARDAWGTEDRLAVSVNMLRLITRLVIEQGDAFVSDEMSTKLSHTTPVKLTTKARELQFDLGSGSIGVNLRRAAKALVKL